MKYVPFRGKIIVRIKENTTTKGGLYIPGNVSERFREGTILSIGEGEVIGTFNDQLVLKPMEVAVEDVVLFDTTRAVKLTESEYIITEHDLQTKMVRESLPEANELH